MTREIIVKGDSIPDEYVRAAVDTLHGILTNLRTRLDRAADGAHAAPAPADVREGALDKLKREHPEFVQEAMEAAKRGEGDLEEVCECFCHDEGQPRKPPLLTTSGWHSIVQDNANNTQTWPPEAAALTATPAAQTPVDAEPVAGGIDVDKRMSLEDAAGKLLKAADPDWPAASTATQDDRAGWNCANCHQLNAHWATKCGRCEQARYPLARGTKGDGEND